MPESRHRRDLRISADMLGKQLANVPDVLAQLRRFRVSSSRSSDLRAWYDLRFHSEPGAVTDVALRNAGIGINRGQQHPTIIEQPLQTPSVARSLRRSASSARTRSLEAVTVRGTALRRPSSIVTVSRAVSRHRFRPAHRFRQSPAAAPYPGSESLRIDRCKKIVQVDPLGDDQWRGKNLLQHGTSGIGAGFVGVQKAPALEIDGARERTRSRR